ncbi:MAG: MFS transporter [Candidatus Nanopelagicales bacterium]
MPETTSRATAFAQRLPWLRGLPREVGVLAAIAFCVALGFGIVAPAIPVFARTFGVTALLAGAVISVFALMRLITSPGAGALVNRVGERAVLSSGLAIVAVSSLLAGFSQTYVQLLVLRGVGGIGSAMFTISAMALLLRTAGPDQRGRAASAFQAGFLFGGITGPAVGGLVVGFSIRAPFFVYAVTLGLATFVAMTFLRTPEQIEAERQALDAATPAATATAAADLNAENVPETEVSLDEHATPVAGVHQMGDSADSEDANAGVKAPAEEEGGKAPDQVEHVTIWAALRNGAYRAALMANLVNGFLTFGIRTSLVPLFVVESLLRGPGLAGVGFLVAAATQGISLIFAGRITDQRGRRPAMLIGMATTALGAILLAVSVEPILFVVSMGVLGVGTAFLGSAPAAVVGDVMGKQRGGTVVAIFQMIADVGAILGPLLAGLLADQLGYHWALGSAALVCLVGIAVVFAMPETKRPQPNSIP